MSFEGIERLRPMANVYTSWPMKIESEEETINRLTEELLAKLNKKKTAAQVIQNLTDATKYKFSVQASASGKVSITEKIRRGFSMRHLRGK